MKHWMTALPAALALAVTPYAASADEEGVLWETTSQTIMPGLPMQQPVQKATMCTAREWDRPPTANDSMACRATNFRRTGNEATWEVQCTGDMPMSGTGAMRFDDDSYTGELTFQVAGMQMLVKLSGRKIGTCTPSAGT